MAEYKTLAERYADEILTNNAVLNHFAQCKNCIFRDKTTVNGHECGWYKCVCFIYEDKPSEIYENTEPCEYYEKEKNKNKHF